ncbi:MAG: pyruvate kinase [Bdellovibrionales bacterium]|nr:pyruvate kinase [Bdellovibrionales bacterium]
MLANRRVKIVGTIGPSTNSKVSLEKAIRSGLNVARLNFSHGSHEDHEKVINIIRELSSELKAPLAILQDLQGPKIRVGKFKDGSIPLESGEVVTISPDIKVGEKGLVPTDFEILPEVVSEGDKILMDDGLIELKVHSVDGSEVRAEVVHGGELKDRKGINLPGADLPVDCMTEKDLDDLEFGLKHRVDYVALSFVRRGSDMKKLRSLVQETSPGTKIIAKIEMLEALDHLEEIISLSDAIMVARGDLAVEVGQAQLPRIQKRIIALSNKHKKPVITATQMLDSMVNNPRPTRAEITDVANAILDGTDALMLSAESATGSHPFKAMMTMHEIAMEVEKTAEGFDGNDLVDTTSTVPESIAAAACLTAKKLGATAIVSLTTSGRTATLISSFRPKARIIAATHKFETLNRLELAWGLQTINIDPYNSSDQAMEQVGPQLVKFGLCKPGDLVILTLGLPVKTGAKTNSIRVYQLSDYGSKEIHSNKLPLRCQPLSE